MRTNTSSLTAINPCFSFKSAELSCASVPTTDALHHTQNIIYLKIKPRVLKALSWLEAPPEGILKLLMRSSNVVATHMSRESA